MINRILGNALSYSVNSYDNLFTLLKENEANEPKIKVLNYDRLFNYNLSIYTYILLQALSKVAKKPYDYYRYTYTGDTIAADIRYKFEDLRTCSTPQMILMFLSQSKFKRGDIQRVITEYGKMDKQINTQIQEMCSDFLGCAIINGSPVIFLTRDTQIIYKTQLICMTIFFKLIEKNIDTKVWNLFRKLTSIIISKEYDTDKIKDIYREYMSDLPEYTIDQSMQFTRMLERLNKKRLDTYLARVNDARSNLNACLKTVEEAQLRYNKENELYTALLNNNGTSKIKEQVDEATNLLSRSKIIKDYGVDYTIIYFTVSQPTSISDSQKWCDIENNAIKDKQIRDLLHKTFVKDQFQLYTECSIGLNMDTLSINRYKDRDSVSFDHAIPQPHISGYNCFGQHTNIIAQLIATNEYAQAIDQAIEAAANINWADSPVISKLNQYLEEYPNIKCFYDPNTNVWFSVDDWRQNETTEANSSDSNN